MVLLLCRLLLNVFVSGVKGGTLHEELVVQGSGGATLLVHFLADLGSIRFANQEADGDEGFGLKHTDARLH
jgi:hypothetical protein